MIDIYDNNELQISEDENNEVIRFIKRFYNHNGNDNDRKETLRSQFRAGYCYYFAVMLKSAFKRGEVCWCAPFGHMCWVDVDGTPYDCEGEYTGEAVYLIPENYLGDNIKNFLHTDDTCNTSKEDILNIIERYRIDKSISEDDGVLKYINDVFLKDC